jgi:hypothetical protein
MKMARSRVMRTTVDIPDPLYRQLKSRAAREGCSVRQPILRGIEGEMQAVGKCRRKRISLPLIRSKNPGTLDIDNAKIFEIIPFP